MGIALVRRVVAKNADARPALEAVEPAAVECDVERIGIATSAHLDPVPVVGPPFGSLGVIVQSGQGPFGQRRRAWPEVPAKGISSAGSWS